MKHPSPKKYARLRIIGAASGIGAQDHACKDGPVAFHHSQAWHELEHHPLVDWGKTLFAYNPDRDWHGTTARLISDLIGQILRLRPGTATGRR